MSQVIPRLKERYKSQVAPSLMKEFGYKNIMQAPRLEKVVLSMGVGQAATQSKPEMLETAVKDLTAISGQKPVITIARKSIAAFRLRAGMKIGCMVTLRGDRMWFFLDKLFNAAIPRIRDFQGINPNAFDGSGNFSMGLREQLVFPEISYDSVDKVRGLNISINTTARTDAEARALLRELGLPLRKENQ